MAQRSSRQRCHGWNIPGPAPPLAPSQHSPLKRRKQGHSIEGRRSDLTPAGRPDILCLERQRKTQTFREGIKARKLDGRMQFQRNRRREKKSFPRTILAWKFIHIFSIPLHRNCDIDWSRDCIVKPFRKFSRSSVECGRCAECDQLIITGCELALLEDLCPT